MAKIDFWEVVFYISLGVFILWAILKIAGVISTPEWLTIGLPALSGGIAIGSFYQKFKQLDKNVEEICKKTSKIYEKCPVVRG